MTPDPKIITLDDYRVEKIASPPVREGEPISVPINPEIAEELFGSGRWIYL